MRGIVIVILSVFMLAACSGGFEGLRNPFSGGGGGGKTGPLPVTDAPLRQPVLEVPPDGVVRLKRDDTIYTVANRYQVPPQDIIAKNNLAAPYSLAGRPTIVLPKPRGHLVVPGDTIESISARYGVSVGAIIDSNALSPPYEVRAGMEVVIPRVFTTTSLALPRIQKQVAPAPVPAPATTESESDTTTTAESESNTTTTATAAATVTAPATAREVGNAVRYSETASRFTWPVDGLITERFGNTSARGVANDGVKITAAADTPVRASFEGEVAFVGTGLKSFGNLVLVKHADGWITAYAHLGDVWVKEGDKVGRGELIGSVGQSGRVDSPQLHFELRKAREPVNPEDFLT